MSLVLDWEILWENYVEDYVSVAITEGWVKDKNLDIDEWLQNKIIKRIIRDDLSEKGFSKGEIQQLIDKNVTNSVSNKFIAYSLLLDGFEWDGVEDLKKLLQKENIDLRDDVISDNDLKQIDKFAQDLDIWDK